MQIASLCGAVFCCGKTTATGWLSAWFIFSYLVRYVRRYLVPETNPVTGEIHDPGYDCLMEIWWNSREDFENSQRIIADPERLPLTKADEANLFSSHANPVCTCIEYDSPMGPNGEATRVEVKFED